MIVYNNPKRSKIVHFISFFIMSNSTQLSEKGHFIAHRKSGMSGHEIEREINRSKTVIHNFLKKKKYGKKKRTGGPSTLTMRQKHTIALRVYSN